MDRPPCLPCCKCTGITSCVDGPLQLQTTVQAGANPGDVVEPGGAGPGPR